MPKFNVGDTVKFNDEAKRILRDVCKRPDLVNITPKIIKVYPSNGLGIPLYEVDRETITDGENCILAEELLVLA